MEERRNAQNAEREPEGIVLAASEKMAFDPESVLNSCGLTVNEAVKLPEAEKPEPDSDDGVCGYEDIDPKSIEFLYFPWFIRGKVIGVQGDSGTGKSTFMYTIGAYVSTGRDIFGSKCENPGCVMFVNLEDSEAEIKTAFVDAAGNVEYLKRIKDRKHIAKMCFGNADDLKFIESSIIKYKIALLVFDPIQAYLSGDMNKANDTRPQMEALAAIAERTGCCIVCIMHETKDKSRKALHRSGGSVDIGASMRSLIQISEDPEDENLIIAYTVKNNDIAKCDREKAITYSICDHPGTKPGEHFHGHAELRGLMSKYNERIHNARVARFAADAEDSSRDFDSDPLVITIMELIKQNPGQSVYIWYAELVKRITEKFGSCRYATGKNDRDGIIARLRKIRATMLSKYKVQLDCQESYESAKAYKPYIWNGKVTSCETGEKKRGVWITPTK